jgi:hypothetical protein
MQEGNIFLRRGIIGAFFSISTNDATTGTGLVSSEATDLSGFRRQRDEFFFITLNRAVCGSPIPVASSSAPRGADASADVSCFTAFFTNCEKKSRKNYRENPVSESKI